MDCVSVFLKQERVVATAVTSFLKYVGNGNMQNGLRVVYRHGEMRGIVIGSLSTCAIIGGGCIGRRVLLNGAKVYQRDKEKLEDAALKVQLNVDTHEDDAL